MMKWLIPLIVLCLHACNVGPLYHKPKIDVSDKWAHQIHTTPSETVPLEWWQIFDDELLSAYIAQAMTCNYDIKIALANVQKARALRHTNQALLSPQINANSNANRSRSSSAFSSFASGQTRNTFDANFDASWEIDIFGGNRKAVDAAHARVGQAEANYRDVLLSVLSNVTRLYYEARGLQKRIAIMEKNLKLLQQTMSLVKARVQIGESNAFDLTRAQGELQLTQARIPNLQAERHANINALAVLLGEPPEAILDEMAHINPLPTPPDLVPIGLRSDLLRRRPDVRQAERALAASVADVGVEVSSLFPQFSLTGEVGGRAARFTDVFVAAGHVWSLTGLIRWPIFQGGAIRARIQAAKAESRAMWLRYQKTVLEAVADTETALTRFGHEIERRKKLQQAVNSRRKAVKLAQDLLQVGEDDYFAVLDAERALITSEDELVISETQSVTKLIALYTALGGGWENQAAEHLDGLS